MNHQSKWAICTITMFTGGYTIFLWFFVMIDIRSYATLLCPLEWWSQVTWPIVGISSWKICWISIIATNHSKPAHPLKPKIFAVPHGEPSAQCTHGAMCFCWAAWWQDVTRLGHRKIHDSNQLDLCSDIYVELRSWNFSLEHELFLFTLAEKPCFW